MGKNYCKVGNKWCKMCSRGQCGYGNVQYILQYEGKGWLYLDP